MLPDMESLKARLKPRAKKSGGRLPPGERTARGALCAALVIIASLAALAYLPLSAIGQEKKSPPPGAPTDRDPRAYVGMSDEQIERLKSGGIVILNRPEDFSGKRLIAAAYILNHDIDTVWNLLTQPWRQEEYLPGLRRSVLIEEYADGSLVEFHAGVLTVNLDYRIRHTNDKASYYVYWKLDPGYENNVKEAAGYFRFYWIDEKRTLVRYGTLVEPKFFIPPKIQVLMSKQALPSALKAVNKWVDSGGTYIKKGYEPEKN